VAREARVLGDGGEQLGLAGLEAAVLRDTGLERGLLGLDGRLARGTLRGALVGLLGSQRHCILESSCQRQDTDWAPRGVRRRRP
jgi:hypothetical protein